MIHRLALRGIPDLASGDLLSRTFWARINFLIRTILDEEHVRLKTVEFDHALAIYTAAAAINPDSLKDFSDHVLARKDAIRDQLHPWRREQEKADQRSAIVRMSAEWKKAYGDPNDPAVAAKIKATAAALLQV